MKRIRTLLLSLLIVLLITGCGSKEQKLVCTNTEKEDGIEIEQVISMTYKGNKLKNMTMEVNTKVTDSNIQENWEEFKNSMDEQNIEVDKDGVRLKVEKNDQTYEYKTTLDIDIENASQEALDSQGFSDLKSDKSTLKSSKEEAEKDNFVCEVK